ncbi:unnamed protein product [Mytilus edulis]|uniref:Uncharacterized protein n=1 Tax=Mytilus edulis TaxID=6550 RepID=A0A8S3TRP7_MYTED|nr:unnamed protein product [Mytilus edulis]
MHDLQRHIKHWCPENESLKRKRDNEDLDNENPSKKSASEWIEYDSGSDDSSEDVNIDDNEGYKPYYMQPLIQRKTLGIKNTTNKSNVHSDIVRQIQDVVENNTDDETQIRRILMKNRHQFNELFDDDYFETNSDTENTDDEDDEEDTDEDVQEKD